MTLTGLELLVLLELHVMRGGKAVDIYAIGNDYSFSRSIITSLERLKLVKVGTRDIDQATPVKLTRAGKRVATAMVGAAIEELR